MAKETFKHIFHLDEAKAKETVRKIELNDAQSTELAARFDFISLTGTKAEFVIDQLEENSLYHVRMHIEATATLKAPGTASKDEEPLVIVIDEDEEDLYTTRTDLVGEGELDIYAPELIEGATIDLGEMFADYLYLMVNEKVEDIIDSYADDYENPDKDVPKEPKAEDTNKPFANLQDLMDKKGK